MTVYYSKIGTLQFTDRTLNLKIDFRARIISLKRLSCPTPGCSDNVTPQQVVRAYLHTGITDPDRLKENIKNCPNCHLALRNTTIQAFKIYTNIDRRINMADLWNGPCQLQYKDNTTIGILTSAIRFREAKEFFRGHYRQTRREWYHIIYTYDELTRIATTLCVIPFTERGLKKQRHNYTATYTPLPLPPLERFETEFNDGLARKLGKMI